MTTNWPEPPRITSDFHAPIVDITVARLRSLVDRVPRWAWLEGMEWYYDAHYFVRNLSAQSGLSRDAVAGIVAALSPRIGWEDNLDSAREVVEFGDEASTNALQANVWKATNIRDGFDADMVLGGRKVRSFYRNITDPWSSLDVTLDTHMATVLELPTERYINRGRGRVYDAISDGFRIVAADHAIMPHQLQATLWVAQRKGREG